MRLSPFSAFWPTAGAAVLAALLQLACPARAAAAEPRTWIVGATVVSPEHGGAGRRLNVLVEGERIAAVTPDLPPHAADGATVVDAAGAFLIPGLIDSHVHLRSVPGMTGLMEYRHPLLVRDYRRQMPRSFLRYGYTTVVDLIVTDRAVLDAFVAAPLHPDLVHCGAVPIPDGYPTQNAPKLVRSLIFPDYVVDAKASGDASHTPTAVVARIRERGGSCIKAFFERGYGHDHDLPVPSADLFAQVVDASHRAGLPVLLHANSLEAQRFGLAGDTDIFAHGLWNWNEFNDAPGLPDPVRAVLDEIAERRIGVMPTMQVLAGLRVLYEPGHLDQPGVGRVVPKSVLDWYRSPDGQWLRGDLAGERGDDQMRARLDGLMRRSAASTRRLAEKGALFLFGSDTPSGPTTGNLPGLNAYLEMQQLVAAQVSLRQLFEAATINNAKAFGLADRVGTIEVGKRANLLLLERSPLESVQAYDTLRLLWIGGRQVEPASLDAPR